MRTVYQSGRRYPHAAAAAVLAVLAGWVGGGARAARGQPATVPAAIDSTAAATAAAHAALDAELRAALDRTGGWARVPRPVYRVRHSGPTPASLDGAVPPVWYQSQVVDGNSRPTPDPDRERAFVASVEAAHAGRTSLVLGGEVLLVDSRRRVWAIAGHTPHLLRCYDGAGWTYRRADGLEPAGDAVAAFFRDHPPGTRRRGRYAAGGLRDLDDPGHWFNPACEDAAGNLHFLGGSASEEVEKRGGGGWGVHTLRPDGTWAFFRLHPVTVSKHESQLGYLRPVLHRPAADHPRAEPAPVPDAAAPDAVAPDAPASAQPATQPSTGPSTRPMTRPATRRAGAGPGDLVTFVMLRLSDPVAAAHGHGVVPIPPDPDQLRHQQWKPWTDEPRNGPTYLLRFDGRGWRVDRLGVGWGVYDMALQVWPQPDGRAYVANRFGLWVEWPPHRWPRERTEKLINDFFAADEPTRAAAAETLASLGGLALPALRAAVAAASLDASRERLTAVIGRAEAAARGMQSAVPAVNGRWRFERAYPEATAADGRFAFHTHRATDVTTGRVLEDCLVFFDPRRPAGESFEVRPIDRPQWRTTDYFDKRANESARGTLIDADGALWVAGGFRCTPDGRLQRMVPPGLTLRSPYFVDPQGRVYADDVAAPNSPALMVYRGGPGGGDPSGAIAGAGGATTTRAADPADGPATRPAELVFENVRGVFRQADLPPPWNAWAVQEADGRLRLLRLDGPEPTVVPLPFGGGGGPGGAVRAIVPLDGGCVAATAKEAGFWDGQRWDVAADVYALVQRHGPRLAKMAPARTSAFDTSAHTPGGGFDHQLLLASDGAGGLWLAEGSRPAGRRLCHWDGDRLVDLWEQLPLKPRRREDGGVMTIGGGRAIVVQVQPDLHVWPGGYWAVWRVTDADVRDRKVPVQGETRPGLHPRLLAALGPNTVFSGGLWADRQGWLWSPVFSETGQEWVRQRDAKVGLTGLPRAVATGAFEQGPGGPIWFTTGKMRDPAYVWADVNGPTDDRPGTYARMAWVGARVPGMGPAARVAAGPDGRTWLFHEAGLSELRLKRLADGERPPLPTRVVGVRPATRPTTGAATGPATGLTIGPATGPAGRSAGGPEPVPGGGGDPERPARWAIEEVARHEWATPRNAFGQVAFDATGVWLRAGNGPLLRVAHPPPRKRAAGEDGRGAGARPAAGDEGGAGSASSRPATRDAD